MLEVVGLNFQWSWATPGRFGVPTKELRATKVGLFLTQSILTFANF